jgi:hypothetical protein
MEDRMLMEEALWRLQQANGAIKQLAATHGGPRHEALHQAKTQANLALTNLRRWIDQQGRR